MTSIASTSIQSHPLDTQALQQTARATYLRTGIDRDAALGDPDKDGNRQGAAPTISAPTGSKTASAVPTVNATPAIQGASATEAAAAYGRSAAH